MSVLVAVAGCAVAGGPATDDDVAPVMSELVISPSGLVATVADEVVVNHEFTATFTATDGTVTDVTDQVDWSLADTRFGKFHGNRLTVMGGGAGPRPPPSAPRRLATSTSPSMTRAARSTTGPPTGRALLR